MGKSKLREKIDEAIAEFNDAIKQEKLIIRIVWGSADEEEAEMAKSVQAEEALMQHLDTDFRLLIMPSSDPSLYVDTVHLSTTFPEPQRLQMDTRTVFNTIKSCEDSTTLRVVRDGEEIYVCGTSTILAVHNVDARSLADALSRLRTATTLVCNYLAKDEGDDWWSLVTGQ